MAARNKKELESDKKVAESFKAAVVDNGNVDKRDELHWESLWHGFAIGKGREDLATYTHYMRLGFPQAMARPAVQAAAIAAAGGGEVEAEPVKRSRKRA